MSLDTQQEPITAGAPQEYQPPVRSFPGLRGIAPWALGISLTVTLFLFIYGIDLFLAGLYFARVVERLEFHTQSHSSAQTIMTDETLELLVNESNKSTWQIFRILHLLDSGDLVNLQEALRKNSLLKSSEQLLRLEKHLSTLNALSQEAIAAQKISDSARLTITNLLSAPFSMELLFELMKQASLYLGTEQRQIHFAEQTSGRLGEITTFWRRYALESVRPDVPPSVQLIYEKLRVALGTVFPELPPLSVLENPIPVETTAPAP